ncbi:Presenilin-domain-containing protein [Gamsiella multidivaricata]|uniref:Presenilin-domain-containing protein n=1 Tax=Gamsiella multidivaricata TaxID=101098 RepID=UPI0022200231|nr:Presenilin-domain-containing protein [Gamsiella multidivaricata]KAG0363961.1 Presenilin-1 [Gamsiella multidivaricata]KAI7818063.1 Presenilin-domain-containing protein [Gamsiella multidivaricata]
MSSPSSNGAPPPHSSPPFPSSTSDPSSRRPNTPPRTNQDTTQAQTGHETNSSSPSNQDNANEADDQPCQACGAFPARFQCSACQSVRYCSQECQAEDWRIHYRECQEVLGVRKQEGQERGTADDAAVGHGSSARAGPAAATIGAATGERGNMDIEQGGRTRSTQPRSANNADDSLGGEAENVRAVANQPRRRPREPRTRPRLTPEQRAAYEEAERIADMKFYMLQIYKIIKPVVICICLSILWVKISMAGSDYRPTQSSYTVYMESSTSTVSQNILGSLANAGIIIAQIVIVTIIIVVLFKRGHIKVLIGFFMIVVAMLLGFMGYILILNLIQVLRIPLDYLTMSFALWNFAVTGLISVFWKGPMWLQQVYLTVMSSLMAFSLTGLAEWTTWMLLALLVVWDLIAVLCPFGPLKILVESSRTQNQDVPALLYTVNAVWFMASPPDSRMKKEQETEGEDEDNAETLVVDGSSSRDANNSRHSRATGRDGGASISSSRNSGLDASSTMALVSQPPTTTNRSADERDHIELRERTRPVSPRVAGGPAANGAAARSASTRQAQISSQGRPSREQMESGHHHEDDDDDDDDGGGLKLGLGDFVFYSVLIARAAMFDWVTTMCCMVAVLTGMNATIFLLAIYQKALPALPISICFGMLFYFATRFALVPFLAVLGPSQVFI